MLNIREEVGTDALQAAVELLVQRHEPLRTTFPTGADGVIVQRISDDYRAPMRVVRCADEVARADALDELFREPFDLERGPLFRWGFFSVSPDDHVLLLVAHHLVTDGWSMDLLHRELSESYHAIRTGRVLRLPALDYQYADYALWERERGEAHAGDVRHWTDAMAGAPFTGELPVDRARPRHRTHACGVVRSAVPATTAAAVDSLAAESGSSRFQVLLAAAYVLLARWTGQSDLVLGTPSANRRSAEVEGMVGFFVNILPLRGRVDEREPFRRLIADARETVMDAYDHGTVPFDRIVEAVAPPRVPGAHPLLQVVLSVAEPATGREPLWGERSDFVGAERAQLDLTLTFSPRPGGDLGLDVYYAAELFNHVTIERLAARFGHLLADLTDRPNDPLALIPATTPEEIATVDALGASRAGPSTPPVTGLFDRQAASRPEAIAVLDDGVTWTYRRLDAVSRSVEEAVRACQLPPATAVAVCVPRSATQIAAMLGVMRAGAVYLPLDPANPPERLRRILHDAGCRLLLTGGARGDGHPWPAEVATVDVSTIPAARSRRHERSPVLPRHPAYVIYTSGSTGRPKGVEVDHASLSSVIQCYAEHYRLGPADRLSQTMNHSFDAGLLDTLPALISGASVAVMPDEVRLDPAALWDKLQEAEVTISFITTALFVAALDHPPAHAGSLRMLQFGGELFTAVPHGLPFPLEHMYGPTEVSIWTSAGALEPGEPVHIGQPVGGLHARILDPWLRPVPIGVAGELFLGGDRLALGYRGAPGMTAARFVPDPWSANGGRMYRTGDRVRWDRAGRLEFLGRTDTQVKLRGFRIELGEIEAVLAEHADVAEAVVVLGEVPEGGKQLCAYLRLHPAGTVHAVLEHAEQHLPAWMRPASYTVLDSFPLSPNAKTDRAALPPPAPAPAREYVPPEGPVENLLAETWNALLNLDKVGRTDDFFQVGGHSLLAAGLLSRIEAATGCRIPLHTLFDHPVLKDLALHVEDAILAAALTHRGEGELT
jgi:amino acid adenylation domain-containing protein